MRQGGIGTGPVPRRAEHHGVSGSERYAGGQRDQFVRRAPRIRASSSRIGGSANANTSGRSINGTVLSLSATRTSCSRLGSPNSALPSSCATHSVFHSSSCRWKSTCGPARVRFQHHRQVSPAVASKVAHRKPASYVVESAWCAAHAITDSVNRPLFKINCPLDAEFRPVRCVPRCPCVQSTADADPGSSVDARAERPQQLSRPPNTYPVPAPARFARGGARVSPAGSDSSVVTTRRSAGLPRILNRAESEVRVPVCFDRAPSGSVASAPPECDPWRAIPATSSPARP